MRTVELKAELLALSGVSDWGGMDGPGVHFYWGAEAEGHGLHLLLDSENPNGLVLAATPSQQSSPNALAQVQLSRAALRLVLAPPARPIFDTDEVVVVMSLSDSEWGALKKHLGSMCDELGILSIAE